MDGLLTFMILAFGSGLAAVLTPCVFPMVPLTVSYFGHDGNRGPTLEATKKKNHRQGIRRALLFGFFIVLIYVVAGTLVAKMNGPEFANWLSTHWLPNLLFFVIFLVFAASFLGMFDITLPNTWVNKMDKKSSAKGTLGVFFMAFTLVLVSFSCTGPIVGSVLVLSAGGQIIKPIVGMLCFSLALALPFTLFAAFPQWLKKLPRSGGWLQEVKVVLGFLELALALKFLSIADQVYHWGILDREVFLAIWIAILTLLGLYLLGKLRLPHDSESNRTTVPKLLMAIVVFSFIVYMVPGMFGAPLKPLSGYLPPMTTQEFNIQSNGIGNDSDNIRRGETNTLPTSGCPEPKHTVLFKLPHGLDGYFDLEQARECAKAQDKPIFVDFTGHGCVNCREMEARVWSDPRVLEILKNDYIILALYVDDKTELPERDHYISEYDGKTKKTIGKQNADYQIVKYVNNAQPFYVLMDSEENLLVEPRAYDLDIENFVEFLESGIEKFESRDLEQ
ncbi:protein-disulfide reductase DsbD [Flagellimonas sp. CMM7]|uniref:protein-disulfide reductase DsbD family protein n=1 Tax=Flagellimonas sp. CMM7 TaxID=2654676 RepID=UPI0013D031D2|nr:cytochrome c biogenesis protein CcdA [Flagellimonas sp. CMM7]UII80282.1 thioredoxin family protein [Flagellimonas sp. CMM7]